jgi:hypothetical protein
MLNIVLLFLISALCLVVGQPPGPRGPPLPNQIVSGVTSSSTTTVQVIDPRINLSPTTLQPPLPNDPPVLLPLHPSLPLFLNPINPVNINRTPQLIQQQPVIVPSVPIPPLRFFLLSDSILTTTSSIRVTSTKSSIISSSPKLKIGVDKRSKTTRPLRIKYSSQSSYNRAIERYQAHLVDATAEQIAKAQAHNTAASAAYNRAQAKSPSNRTEEESHRVTSRGGHKRRNETLALSKSNPQALTPSQQHLLQTTINADAEKREARLQRKSNPENMTERQHQVLASNDRRLAEVSEALIQRNSNPENMTERQQQILVSKDRTNAEISEARLQRILKPQNMTARQHQVLVSSDRAVAERAIQIAADRRLAQETFLGLQLPVHTPVERASMLQNIINALQSFFFCQPICSIQYWLHFNKRYRILAFDRRSSITSNDGGRWTISLGVGS